MPIWVRARFEANSNALNNAVHQLHNAAVANTKYCRTGWPVISSADNPRPSHHDFHSRSARRAWMRNSTDAWGVPSQVRLGILSSSPLSQPNPRDYNMQARISNGRVALPRRPLRVLLDVCTAQPIANFPVHLAAIQSESTFLLPSFRTSCRDCWYSNSLDHRNIFRELLEALGITSQPNAQWSIEDARLDFRVAIGCLPI